MNQLDVLRKMTGEKRLEQAFQLSELTHELAVSNIKEQFGMKASLKLVREKLAERLKKD